MIIKKGSIKNLLPHTDMFFAEHDSYICPKTKWVQDNLKRFYKKHVKQHALSDALHLLTCARLKALMDFEEPVAFGMIAYKKTNRIRTVCFAVLDETLGVLYIEPDGFEFITPRIDKAKQVII